MGYSCILLTVLIAYSFLIYFAILIHFLSDKKAVTVNRHSIIDSLIYCICTISRIMY